MCLNALEFLTITMKKTEKVIDGLIFVNHFSTCLYSIPFYFATQIYLILSVMSQESWKYTCPHSPENSWPLLLHDYCYYIYTYIHKYSLFSSYSVNCMHVFRADYLTLDNQFARFFLRKATSPIASFPQLPIFLFRIWASRVSLYPAWHLYWCYLLLAHICLIMLVRLESYNF